RDVTQAVSSEGLVHSPWWATTPAYSGKPETGVQRTSDFPIPPRRRLLSDRRTRPRSCKVIDGNALGLGVRSGGVGWLRRPDSPRLRTHSKEPSACKVIRKCWMP